MKRQFEMEMVIMAIAIFLLTFVPVAMAHHPAEDMVDAEVYAMIDALVADTPHADLVFDETMGNERMIVIEVDSVGTTDDLINHGLVDDFSILDGEVTVTMEFLPEDQPALMSVDEVNQQGQASSEKWSEWGSPVRITVQQVLP